MTHTGFGYSVFLRRSNCSLTKTGFRCYTSHKKEKYDSVPLNVRRWLMVFAVCAVGLCGGMLLFANIAKALDICMLVSHMYLLFMSVGFLSFNKEWRAVCVSDIFIKLGVFLTLTLFVAVASIAAASITYDLKQAIVSFGVTELVCLDFVLVSYLSEYIRRFDPKPTACSVLVCGCFSLGFIAHVLLLNWLIGMDYCEPFVSVMLFIAIYCRQIIMVIFCFTYIAVLAPSFARGKIKPAPATALLLAVTLYCAALWQFFPRCTPDNANPELEYVFMSQSGRLGVSHLMAVSATISVIVFAIIRFFRRPNRGGSGNADADSVNEGQESKESEFNTTVREVHNMELIRDLHKSDMFTEGTIDFPLFGKEIGIFIDEAEGGVDVAYAKRCVSALHSMKEETIDSLCDWCLRYYRFMLGEWEDFSSIYSSIVDAIAKEIPEDIAGRDILAHVHPHSMHVLEKKDDRVGYSIKCECVWEPEHGLLIVILEDEVRYVGPFDDLSPWDDFGDLVY